MASEAVFLCISNGVLSSFFWKIFFHLFHFVVKCLLSGREKRNFVKRLCIFIVYQYIFIHQQAKLKTRKLCRYAISRKKLYWYWQIQVVHFCGRERAGGGGCGHVRVVVGGYIPPATHTVFPISTLSIPIWDTEGLPFAYQRKSEGHTLFRISTLSIPKI